MATEPQKQRILYVITKANWGGAQRYVYDLATHLPRDAYAPMVAFGVPGRLAEMLRDASIPCRHVPALGRDVSLSADVRAFFGLISLIREERPAIVHLNSSKAAGLGALAARISNLLPPASCQLPVRIIVTIHGLPQDEPRGALARITIVAFTWLTCILAHEVICVTEENAERLRSGWFLSRKVRHVPNGIAPFPLASREASRETLRLPVHAIVVGAIAELHRNKGLDVLIRAIALTPGVHACIIGDGEEREHLETLAHELDVTDRVQFVGFVPDARRYLSAFDVFCLPSRKEGLPYVVLEAGHASLSVVGSDLPGIREAIGNTGTLMTPGDAPALAASLARLASNDTERQHIGSVLHARVATKFTLEHMVVRTVEMYQ